MYNLAFLSWTCHWVLLSEVEQIRVLMGWRGMHHLARLCLWAEVVLRVSGLQQEKLKAEGRSCGGSHGF